MTLKFLTAEQQSNRYYFQVWMDTTKTDSSGAPDPAYVKEFEYILTPPTGLTATQYQANIKTEITTWVNDALAAMQTPITLTGF